MPKEQQSTKSKARRFETSLQLQLPLPPGLRTPGYVRESQILAKNAALIPKPLKLEAFVVSILAYNGVTVMV